MPFIATIAKENDSNFMKNLILKNSIKTKFEIINITEKNIENLKNIKFDIVVINEKIDEFLLKSNYLIDIINNSKYTLINFDMIKYSNFIKNKNVNIIKYGLSHKADFTISSINDLNILLCLQKPIVRINNKIIEEQEFNVIVKKNNMKKIHNMLPTFLILNIFGEFLQKN